jgi:hypothetical protein
MVGCAPTTINTTTTKYPDGKEVVNTVTTKGGVSVANKTIVAGGGARMIKVESSGSTSTGTLTPNVLLGDTNTATLIVHKDDDRPYFIYTKSMSLLSSLFSASASGITIIYRGLVGETAEQTVKRVNALMPTEKTTEPTKEEIKDTTAATTTSGGS